MFKSLFIFALLNINFSLLLGAQTVNLEETTICLESKACETVNSIYIPTKLDTCTDDLLFQFGDTLSAYLSQDGNISGESKQTECHTGYKRVEYALKNLLIEVIKHKDSVYVKSVTEKKNESSLSQFIHQKFHDFIQYLLILSIVILNFILYMFKSCANQTLRR